MKLSAEHRLDYAVRIALHTIGESVLTLDDCMTSLYLISVLKHSDHVLQMNKEKFQKIIPDFMESASNPTPAAPEPIPGEPHISG